LSAAEDARRQLARVGALVLERGWLSSNNVVFASGPSGAAVVDTGYVSHAALTVELIAAALNGSALRRVVNTHLHSDHCGGNAALQARWGCRVALPAPSQAAVACWDTAQLTYAYTGQQCPRFQMHEALAVQATVELAGRPWTVLPARGHDPDAVMLFESESRILIAGDALWETRVAINFPELTGQAGFADAAATLDQIAALVPRLVVPGHGAPFENVDAALQRARSLLARYQSTPTSHHLHAARALLMFHLMDIRSSSHEEAIEWLSTTPVFLDIWERCDRPFSTLDGFANTVIQQLLGSGALRQDGEKSLALPMSSTTK